MLLPAVVLLASSLAASGQFDARLQAGMAALDKNDLASAQTSLEEATRLAPEHAGAWLLLAQTYAKQKNRESALAAAQKAEALGGEDPKILQGLANFYVGLLPDLPKAAALGARYAERSPQDKTAWRRLAAFCLSTGQPERAIAAGLRGLATDGSAELHALLGRAYLERQDWAKATAELKTALELDPYEEDTHFRLAQAFLLRQDFSSAVSVLEAAKKIFARSPQIELALGVAYYGLRRFPEAVDQFLKTMKLAPDVPQPYVFLGRILDHASDRLPEVIERFAQFEARNPNNYLGYLLHAKGLIAQVPPAGFPPEAQAAFELLQKSLALQEDDAEGHYLLGVLLDRKGDLKDAAAHLERSIQLDPRGSAAHYRLARVYDRLGRKQEADEQRVLHEKLSEEENATGGPGLAKDPLRPPAPGRVK